MLPQTTAQHGNLVVYQDPSFLSALSFPCRSTNAITDPHAGHESGDQSAPVGSSDKIIRGHAGDSSRELRGVPLSTVPRHLLSRQSRSRSSQAFEPRTR